MRPSRLLLALALLAGCATARAPEKLLIVHADDFGMARSVNAATIAALQSGLVTSASIMVPTPHFDEAAAWARQNPGADLGIHLTLTSEWKTYRWGAVLPKQTVPTLYDEAGFLYPSEATAAARASVAEVEKEVRAQIDRAIAAGIRPTHLDTHMRTLHQNADLFDVLLRVSRDYRIPAAIPKSFLSRPDFAALIRPTDVVIDRFETIGPGVPPEGWAEFYADIVRELEPGITELIVHVARDDEEMRSIAVDHPGWGSAWRQRDFDYLTSDAFRRVLAENGVRLTTWREVARKQRRR